MQFLRPSPISLACPQSAYVSASYNLPSRSRCPKNFQVMFLNKRRHPVQIKSRLFPGLYKREWPWRFLSSPYLSIGLLIERLLPGYGIAANVFVLLYRPVVEVLLVRSEEHTSE